MSGLEHEELTQKIIGAAIRVHRALGPGLLESVYESCLCHELVKLQLHVARQVPVSVVYDGVVLDVGFRIDVLVEKIVVIEVKAADELRPVHEAQLMTYLRLSRAPIGLIINFNVNRLRDGLVRRAMSRTLAQEESDQDPI